MEGLTALALGQTLGAIGDVVGGHLVRVSYSGSAEQMLIGTSATSIVLLTFGCVFGMDEAGFGSLTWWSQLVRNHPERMLQNGLLAVAYHLAEAKLFRSKNGATVKVR